MVWHCTERNINGRDDNLVEEKEGKILHCVSEIPSLTPTPLI